MAYPSYLEQDRGGDAGADHRGRRRVPGRAARRLPPALALERRRLRDRADGGDGDRPRPRVHGAHRPLGAAHDRPRARRAAARATSSTRSARINADIAAAGHDFRILTGMEVDILEDGALDLADSMLARLDVVVASVHSKLRMERTAMTERMVLAVASPHVDILGHCTGRLIGKRPESQFDADFVFAACAQFGTAVEINCRPGAARPAARADRRWRSTTAAGSRSTPTPTPPGQLEWQPHGCDRAAERRGADRADHQHHARRQNCSPGRRRDVTDAVAPAPGPLIAAGSLGGHLRVRRRQGAATARRRPRPIPAHEPIVMRAVRAAGYPVPEVFDVDGRRHGDGACRRRRHGEGHRAPAVACPAVRSDARRPAHAAGGDPRRSRDASPAAR